MTTIERSLLQIFNCSLGDWEDMEIEWIFLYHPGYFDCFIFQEWSLKMCHWLRSISITHGFATTLNSLCWPYRGFILYPFGWPIKRFWTLNLFHKSFVLSEVILKVFWGTILCSKDFEIDNYFSWQIGKIFLKSLVKEITWDLNDTSVARFSSPFPKGETQKLEIGYWMTWRSKLWFGLLEATWVL